MAYGGNDDNDQWGDGQGNSPRRSGLGVSSQSLSSMPRSPAEALEPSRGPQSPHQKKPRRKLHPALAFINGVLTLLIVGGVAAVIGVYFLKYQFSRQGPLDYGTVVDIRKGMGVNQIANKLHKEGVVRHWSVFWLSWYFVHKSPTLKAGEYAITKGASVNDVLQQLRRGRGIFNKITIPEGFTSQMVVKRINTHPRLTGYIDEVPPEGSILPDTYTYSSNTDRNEILRRMQDQQKKFIAREWKKRISGLPVKTAAEALVLASIVEKETGHDGERDKVAGVFINRLRKGMRLQSDPTIIYGLVGGKGTLGRPIFRSEIRSKTAYNTYVIKGLPPTPIANPGRAAIKAVLNPARTKDLYFVANGTGGHAFAPTLRKHKENVKEWRKIEKEIRKRQKEAAKQKILEEARKEAAVVPGVSISEDENQKQSNGEGINKWPTVSEKATGANQSSGTPLPERRPQ